MLKVNFELVLVEFQMMLVIGPVYDAESKLRVGVGRILNVVGNW